MMKLKECVIYFSILCLLSLSACTDMNDSSEASVSSSVTEIETSSKEIPNSSEPAQENIEFSSKLQRVFLTDGAVVNQAQPEDLQIIGYLGTYEGAYYFQGNKPETETSCVVRMTFGENPSCDIITEFEYDYFMRQVQKMIGKYMYFWVGAEDIILLRVDTEGNQEIIGQWECDESHSAAQLGFSGDNIAVIYDIDSGRQCDLYDTEEEKWTTLFSTSLKKDADGKLTGTQILYPGGLDDKGIYYSSCELNGETVEEHHGFHICYYDFQTKTSKTVAETQYGQTFLYGDERACFFGSWRDDKPIDVKQSFILLDGEKVSESFTTPVNTQWCLRMKTLDDGTYLQEAITGEVLLFDTDRLEITKMELNKSPDELGNCGLLCWIDGESFIAVSEEKAYYIAPVAE